MKGFFADGIIRCLLYDHLPLTCLFVTHIYELFCAHIYARLYPQGRKERKYTWQKKHVYRVAGMIASIRGKKPHVYRVIILKQMADHKKRLKLFVG